LIKELKRSRGLVFVVSHNRTFLTAVSPGFWSFAEGEETAFSGDYEAFSQMTAHAKERQRHDYEAGRREQKRLTEQARLAGERSNRAKKINPHKHSHAEREQIKSGMNGVEKGLSQRKKVLQGRLERMIVTAKPKDPVRLTLQATAPLRPGKPVLTAVDLTVRQGDVNLLEGVTLRLTTGKRVAITGPNGSGKTSLIDQLLRGGRGITTASDLRVSVANQDLSQLDPAKNALVNVLADSAESPEVARNFLGAMGIRLDQVNELVGVMSGGERVRVALVRALLSGSDLLILDEPTNFLDIPALDALATYLQTTTQAVLFVSHDEKFVTDVATEVLEIANHRLVEKR
jgi:ATPase subunit of ABC transporter with duplicated ATPase domains